MSTVSPRAVAALLGLALLTSAPRALADAAVARVTFIVTAPPTTPGDATLFVSGNLAELGNWNGAGVRLVPIGEWHYVATVRLLAGEAIEFKVTRGSWDTVEKGPAGEEIGNHRGVAHDGDTLRITVATWREGASGGAAKHSTRSGDVRVHTAFASKYVKPRDVLVWLPPGYAADSTRRYPVLYFHDGNNVFDDSTSFVGEWHLDEIAARLVGQKVVEPFIAVAVYNTADRMNEYTPVADARHGGGGSGEYAEFLIDELKPFIDRTYRTRPDPRSTGIVGSSLGGLVSLAIAIDLPEVFGLVGAVSPSAWWANGWLAHRAAKAPRSLRVWLDIGTAEGAADEAPHEVERVRAVRDALLGAGLAGRAANDSSAAPGLHYEEIAGGRHNEAAWSARLDRILEFLLPAAAAHPAVRAR